MRPNIEERAIEWIDQRRSTIIEFLRQIVTIPSVTGEELDIQKCISRKLNEMGLQVDTWEPDMDDLKKHPAYLPPERDYKNRPNVVGVYKGTGGGRSLLFNGHVDVIPSGPPDAWIHPPWGGMIEGSRLYGRGASDMKSGLAAMTMALDALIQLGVRLKGDVILEYTMDEEATGNGTLACVMRGYRADAGICCETSSLHVQPACIGRIWFEILVRGKPAGIQRRWEGVNASYTTMTLQDWLDSELDKACEGGNVIIASIVAHPEPADTGRNAKRIEDTGKVAMFEINVSCPMPADKDRVGFQMGNDPDMCSRQVEAVKKAVSLPVGIKLTPTTHNMVPMAEAAERAGADFLTIGNSVRSFAGVDITTGLPRLPAYGGYSGPAIKPIAQRHVSEVAKAVKIPISACGGISTWEDVVEYIMLGATTVQICTSIMWKGYEHFKPLLKGLSEYMEREGLVSLDTIRGKTLPHIVTIDELAKKPPMAASVDPEKCINLIRGGCEACGKVCFYGAIQFAPGFNLNPEHCDGCGLCMEICPSNALRMVPL